MGLDIVELIMRSEEEFAIEIPDSEAERISTPGALCDFIESRLFSLRTHSSSSACPTSLAFYAVRRELMQLGIERPRVMPKTPLAELWPASERRNNWRTLEKRLNYRLPILRRPPEWTFVGLFPLAMFPIWLWVSPVTAVVAFALYLLAAWFVSQATEPLAVHPSSPLYSVADLSRSLAPRFITSAVTSALDTWEQVRAIIADECSIPIEKVTRDAHFIYSVSQRRCIMATMLGGS